MIVDDKEEEHLLVLVYGNAVIMMNSLKKKGKMFKITIEKFECGDDCVKITKFSEASFQTRVG